MSANNQTLLKKHKGKWYVFSNIQAESWAKENVLFRGEADYVLDTAEEAIEKANEVNQKTYDYGYEIEYGVSNVLIKDGADVIIK